MRRNRNAYRCWSKGFQSQSTSAKYHHRTNHFGPQAGMPAQQPTGRHTFRRSSKTNSSLQVAESAMATAIFPDDLQESFQQGTLTLFSTGQAVKKHVFQQNALMPLSISQKQDRMLEIHSQEQVVETSKWKCSYQHEQIKNDSMFAVLPRIYSKSQWKKRINNLKSIAKVDTNKEKLLLCTDRDRTEPDKVPDELFQQWTEETETDASLKYCSKNSRSTPSQSKQILSDVNRVSDYKSITIEVKKDMTKHATFSRKEDNGGVNKELDSEVVSSGDWLNTRKYDEPFNINALAYSYNVDQTLELKVFDSFSRHDASQSGTMHVIVLEQDKNGPCLKSEQPNNIHVENKVISSVDHNQINIIAFQKAEKASSRLDDHSEDMFPSTPEKNQTSSFLENKSATKKYSRSLIHEHYISDDAENCNDFPSLYEAELIYPSQNFSSKIFSSGRMMNNGKNGNVDHDALEMVYPSQEHTTCLLNKEILPCQNRIIEDSVTDRNLINNQVLVPLGKIQQFQNPEVSKITLKAIYYCQNQIISGDQEAGVHSLEDETVFSSRKRHMLRNSEDSKAHSDEWDYQKNQQNSFYDDEEAVPPSQNSDITKFTKTLPDIHKFIVPALDADAFHEVNDSLSFYSNERTFLCKMKR